MAQIEQQGSITVATYMDEVAATYYAQGQVFGKEGDFVTASEISQIFGELVGLWCVTAWQALGQPRHFNLVECGPGRGTLMADVLRTVWDVAPEFARAASLHLIERSPSLREQQRQNLAPYEIDWHDDLSSLPAGQVIIVGNEFLDALPISQFVKTPAGWCERLVTCDTSGLKFDVSPLPDTAIDDTFDDAPDGSILERSEAVENVTSELAVLCTERPGVALLIDYGHTITDVGDTLQAVKKHAFHPVLDTPGEADLTAHVDFAVVGQVARSQGASIHGPVEQGQWLNRLGARVRETQLADGKSVADAALIRSGIRRLIDPDKMGRMFKVIAIGPTESPPLSGFTADADL